MPDIAYNFETLFIFILLTFAIYSIIMAVFIKASRKYKGGIIGKAIQFIIGTICFFLLADFALFLIPSFGFKLGYLSHVVLKICALTCLVFGGLKFSDS